MNIFLHELKSRQITTAVWLIAMVVFITLSMAKYQTLSASGLATFKQLAAQFPRTIQTIFGMDGLDPTIAGEYYGICFLLIAVLLAIHAGLTGSSVISSDEEDRVTEFLYSKPRSRTYILTAKWLAGAAIVLAMWGTAVCTSIITISKFAKFDNFWSDFWLLMIAGLSIQVLFFSVGVTTAATTSRLGMSARLVSIAVFSSYVLYVLERLSDMFSWARYLSVFSYFDAASIIRAHAVNPRTVILCASVSVCLFIFGYVRFKQRDLRS
ncbi:MAG: ABC transporter permease subunit [Candidatus Saccharimonas sp.]|nr:ABC transporter permease subunit [Candidatus Saccharimonas sp.]